MLIVEYRRQLAEAGFAAVEVIDTQADLNAYAASVRGFAVNP